MWRVACVEDVVKRPFRLVEESGESLKKRETPCSSSLHFFSEKMASTTCAAAATGGEGEGGGETAWDDCAICLSPLDPNANTTILLS